MASRVSGVVARAFSGVVLVCAVGAAGCSHGQSGGTAEVASTVTPLAVAPYISPFPSTVDGLSIPNAHVVGVGQGRVLRGMAPINKSFDKTAELKRFGVTDVIVFKEDKTGEIAVEKDVLSKLGYKPESIHYFPFRWKNIPPFKIACEQTIDALAVLETAYTTPGRTAYFHCTVGEDRTGMLAGLFRMVEQKGWSARRAFDEEMCLNGYGDGNPQKPPVVLGPIHDELTPLFLRLATMVEAGAIVSGRLDRGVCARPPVEVKYKAEDFVCKASGRYRAE